MNKPPREPTLGEILDALQEHGRDEDADKYWWELLQYAFIKGILPDELLSMTLDECVRSVNIPKGKAGWNTMWGEKVVYPDR